MMVMRAMCGRPVAFVVGAFFRREWRLAPGHCAPQSQDHVHQHSIVMNSQLPIGKYLQGRVAVTDMPCQTGKLPITGRAYVSDILLRRTHRNDAAVVEQKAVAIVQNSRLVQIKPERASIAIEQNNAATITVMIR